MVSWWGCSHSCSSSLSPTVRERERERVLEKREGGIKKRRERKIERGIFGMVLLSLDNYSQGFTPSSLQSGACVHANIWLLFFLFSYLIKHFFSISPQHHPAHSCARRISDSLWIMVVCAPPFLFFSSSAAYATHAHSSRHVLALCLQPSSKPLPNIQLKAQLLSSSVGQHQKRQVSLAKATPVWHSKRRSPHLQLYVSARVNQRLSYLHFTSRRQQTRFGLSSSSTGWATAADLLSLALPLHPLALIATHFNPPGVWLEGTWFLLALGAFPSAAPARKVWKRSLRLREGEREEGGKKEREVVYI